MMVPRLKVGSATVHLLNDGFWWDDGGAMFGIVPKVLWNREKRADADNKIHMSLVCPLVLVNNEVILIDAGIGNRLGDRERSIYRPERGTGLAGCMQELGVEAGDVTLVVLSHLHFDHCGGVIHKDACGAAELAFPNARYVMQRREYETALRPATARDAAAYPHAAESLPPTTGRPPALGDGGGSRPPSGRTRGTIPAKRVGADRPRAGFRRRCSEHPEETSLQDPAGHPSRQLEALARQSLDVQELPGPSSASPRLPRVRALRRPRGRLEPGGRR